MRQDPLSAGIGDMLQKFRRMESWMRRFGIPPVLARMPVWVLCLHYCLMMRGKTARIAKVAERIERWLDTIKELSRQNDSRTELIDMDQGMRNDIESTKRTLLALRGISLDVGTMFCSIGFRSRLLDRTQQGFLNAVDASCATAMTLQDALETHDRHALLLLRQMAQAAGGQAPA